MRKIENKNESDAKEKVFIVSNEVEREGSNNEHRVCITEVTQCARKGTKTQQ